MTRSYLLVAGACVVSLGLGFVAGGNWSPALIEKNPEIVPADSRPSKSSPRNREALGNSGGELLAGILKGRSAKELSDGELATIIVKLSKYDATQSSLARARQSYQLQLLLDELPASRLEEAAAAIASDPDHRRTSGLNTILNAMASKDPQRAMAWAKTQPRAPSLLASVLGTMAKDDPLTAAEIYRDSLINGTFSQNEGWQASYGIGASMARLGKNAFLDFMDSLPHQQQGNLLSNCFRELPESDRAGMMDEVYQRSKDGRIQDWSFKNIFTNALSSDPTLAESWLSRMESGKERASLELSAANFMSRNGDADAARDWMSRAISQSQGNEKELLGEAINQMSHNNPGDIAVFASLLPKGIEISAEDLKNQATSSFYQGFDGLADLARAIRDPAEQTKLITQALQQLTSNAEQSPQSSRLNATDFEILSHQIQSLNFTGENATKIAEALATAQSATRQAKE